jgi:OmpA-OmpF porin, OOP family
MKLLNPPIFWLGALLFTGWTWFATYWYVCKIRLLCDDTVVQTQVPSAVKYGIPLKLTDSQQVTLIGSEVSAFFPEGKADLELSGGSFPDFSAKIKEYLAAHPEAKITVTGFFTSAEAAQTPGIGMSRAKSLADDLIKAGIDSAGLILKEKEIPSMADGTPLLSLIAEGTRTPEPVEQVKNYEFHAKEILVYFKLGTDEIINGDELAKFVEDIKPDLEKAPKTQLFITGHTSDEGETAANYELALKRAKAVDAYIVAKTGVAQARISTGSKGETQPRYPNANEAGRIKNRRVEVYLK